MFGPLSDEIVGITFRRLKWHVAEYNRIAASRDLLKEQAREVEKALYGHRITADECAAIMTGVEPDWGGEKDITLAYLDWDGSDALKSYVRWTIELSKDPDGTVSEPVAQEPV